MGMLICRKDEKVQDQRMARLTAVGTRICEYSFAGKMKKKKWTMPRGIWHMHVYISLFERKVCTAVAAEKNTSQVTDWVLSPDLRPVTDGGLQDNSCDHLAQFCRSESNGAERAIRCLLGLSIHGCTRMHSVLDSN